MSGWLGGSMPQAGAPRPETQCPEAQDLEAQCPGAPSERPDERPEERPDEQPEVVEVVPAQMTPLYRTVLRWAEQSLAGQGYPVPLVKRLAVLVTGLVAGERGSGRRSVSGRAQWPTWQSQRPAKRASSGGWSGS